MLKQSLVFSFFIAPLVFAQAPSSTNFGGQPGTVLSNGKLQLVALTKGASVASIVMSDDAEKLNPMWNTLGRAGDILFVATTTSTDLPLRTIVDSVGAVAKSASHKS